MWLKFANSDNFSNNIFFALCYLNKRNNVTGKRQDTIFKLINLQINVRKEYQNL